MIRVMSTSFWAALLVVLALSEGRPEPCSVPEIREKKGSETRVVEVVAGKDVKLICRVNEKGVSAYWLKDHKTLHPSDHQRMRIKTNKWLRIKRTETGDTGFYTCVAENDCGRNVYTIQLLVESETTDPNLKAAAPRFTVSLEKLARNLLSFPVGNSVKMDCSADGYPRPTVRWYKDEKLFRQRKGGRRLYLSPSTLVLTMKGLVPTDSGKYTCNVSNAHGWINHTYHLDVHERVRAEPVVLPMKNVTVYEGENATLLCKALSDSMPHFQWLRWFQSPSNGSNISKIEYPHYEVIKQNDQVLNQHLVLPQSNNKFDFHGQKLTLVNVTKKDEGKYTCIVGNAVGYAVEQAYVIVYEGKAAPRFTVSPEKLARNLLSFPVGNSVKMDCSADGYPRPTVRWFKDEKLFQQRKGGSRLYLSPSTLVLTMKGLVPTDSGKYTCNVSNAHGWISHTYYVAVKERVRAKPVILPMKNVTVYEGENATLLCKALSDSMPHFQWLRWVQSPLNGLTNSAIEHPHYEVIKQNEQDLNQQLVLPQSSNKFDFHGVKLTLVNVTKKNEGKYTCIVGNAVGYAVVQAYVIVYKQKAAPRFTVSPEKLARNLLSFPVGNSVKMDCSADGYPRPTVRWFKDGALFRQRKGGRRLYLSPSTLVLTMKGLVPTDSGKYTCNVSNAHGWISHTYYVAVKERVRAKPVILPMKNVTVHEGENATLLCKALSDSMPHFQWLRWLQSPSNRSTNSTIERPHYEVIKQNDRKQNLVLPQSNNKFNFHGVKLTLVNVGKKHEGKYSCIVGNAVGYAVEQAYVIVYEGSGMAEKNGLRGDKLGQKLRATSGFQ